MCTLGVGDLNYASYGHYVCVEHTTDGEIPSDMKCQLTSFDRAQQVFREMSIGSYESFEQRYKRMR